jgi:chondroitin AC lyase
MRSQQFLIALLLIGTVIVKATKQDDFAIVRENVRKIMLWPTPDQLPAVIAQAAGNLSTLDKNTCQWPDLNYTTRGPENWDSVLHMFRISTMTTALTAPGGMTNDTGLSYAVHCALKVWIEQDWQNPNWWWNTIQDPLIATGIMLMLSVERMSTEEVLAIKTMSYRADWWINDASGGANLVWMLQVQMFRGLATSNYSAVAQAFDHMWQTVQIQNLTVMGIQTDWSYHFHGQQLLTAAYGDAWATNILHFHLATRGTQYALSKDRLETFGRFLTEGDAWFTMGSVWTWGIIGRVIDRGIPVWYTHLFQSDQLRTLAMDITNASTAAALYHYTDRLEHNHEAPPLVGNRHFYTSDFQVHRRANWTAALKMHSVRTTATECDNFENLKGEHIGDGVLNLYTRDAQYGSGEEYENIFALLDWQSINGITVESDTPLLPCVKSQFAMLKTAFVGGVSDGNYGAAIMDTATHNMTAKRTWHFYDDFIIALATGIQDNTTALLQTTVVSRLLPPTNTVEGTLTIQWSNGTRMILVDGIYSFPSTEPRVLWFHTDGTIWIVSGDYAALTIDCRNKFGNVNQIGPWNFEMQARLLTAAIVHGRGPTSKALNYTYMIIPNITIDRMPSLWTRYMLLIDNTYTYEQPQNDNTVLHIHGFCDAFVRRASVLLFDSVSTVGDGVYYNCSNLSLSVYMEQAGAFLYSENSDNFTVTAAHPTLAQGTLAISVNRGSITTAECTNDVRWQSQAGTRILLTLPGSNQLLGMSVSVTCKKASDLTQTVHTLE